MNKPTATSASSVIARRATPEQQAVVEHPLGHHALVLAVAGSGKTTTLVERAAHLIEVQGVSPSRILVLMFNAAARRQFQQRAQARGLPSTFVKQIHSFHSFSFRLLQASKVITASTRIWAESEAELQRLCLQKAISSLEKQKVIQPDEIDFDEAETAISLWKGALIPPNLARAGYRGHSAMPEVYLAYEALRRQETALTFDDFVPEALRVLWRPRGVRLPVYDHIIADEYQDVNFGQQALIEGLAGHHADVMAVGDDDQTVYEWRGARPQYITALFPERFAYKSTEVYTLSHTFRFGPVLAQCAENLVSFNGSRRKKRVVAHDPSKQTGVHILAGRPDDLEGVTREMVRELQALLRPSLASGTIPEDHLIVLGRTFSQLAGLESEFLRQRIPYRVIGQKPFFQRREIAALLSYVRLAERFLTPMDAQDVEAFLSILNVPSRFLPRATIGKTASHFAAQGGSVRDLIHSLASDAHSRLNASQIENLHEFLEALGNLALRVNEPAYEALTELIFSIKCREYFQDYYGPGESSKDRLLTLDAFLGYVADWDGTLGELRSHIESLDSTCGAPLNQQIPITTVYRTKGLEYDYVFIPSCVEGYMPFPADDECPIYDVAGEVPDPSPSEAIESERRIFYVAITRARKAVFIGTVRSAEGGSTGGTGTPQMSRFVHELRSEPVAGMFECLIDRRVQDTGHLFRHIAAIALRERDLIPAVETLVDQYLPAVGADRLASDLKTLMVGEPSAPFYYPEKYEPLPKRNKPSSPPPPQPPPAWSKGWLEED